MGIKAGQCEQRSKAPLLPGVAREEDISRVECCEHHRGGVRQCALKASFHDSWSIEVNRKRDSETTECWGIFWLYADHPIRRQCGRPRSEVGRGAEAGGLVLEPGE